MKGLEIFSHSIRLIFRNFGAAVKASAVPSLIQIAVLGVFFARMWTGPMEMPMGGMGQMDMPWISLLLVLLVTVVCGTWIAVVWHRYVLLEEEPGILPQFRAGPIGSYMWNAFLIGLILILPVVLLVFISSGILAVAGQHAFAMVLFQVVIVVPILMLWFRLATVLPGIALGEDRKLTEGWAATQGETGTLLGLAFLFLAASLALGLVGKAMAGLGVYLALTWEVFAWWFQAMVGISVLTTLYGHLVQKRPLS